MYCNNCGLRADPEDIFCSGCGKRIKGRSGTGSSEHEVKDSGFKSSTPGEPGFAKTALPSLSNRKAPVQRYISKGIWIIALICVSGALLTAYPTFALDSDKYPDTNSLISQDRVQTDKNIRLCEQIAAEYCNSHTYSKDDVYDCDNMAQDVWNMLKAKGINARIAVGNFDSAADGKIANGKTVHNSPDSGNPGEFEILSCTYGNANLLNSTAIDSFNHAWVLAEVSPGSWIAIECTGGYIVYSDENEKYYQGLTFSDPKNYRSFLSLYRDWKIKALDYETERAYYNELIKPYNNASYSEQLAMKSGIDVAQRTLYEKERAFLKTDSELNALLRYG